MSGGASLEPPRVRLRRAAMDCLARREHSRHELAAKLAEKFPDLDRETLIEAVLRELAEENLQSDERFVENFVRYKAGRGDGPVKIRAELRHKGVEGALLQRYLHGGGHDWIALARQALEKKFGGAAGPDSPGEQQRRYRFLAQRGFDSEQIRAAMRDPENSDW